MAVVRDQAARVLRPDAVETPTPAGGDAATETSVALAEQFPSDVAEKTKRRPSWAPEKPVIDKPAAAPEAPAAAGAPKSGKRKFVMMGAGLVLALAAASYAGYYTLVRRLYFAPD